MSASIRSTSLRFNLEKEPQRRVWEYLQAMDRTRFRSYNVERIAQALEIIRDKIVLAEYQLTFNSHRARQYRNTAKSVRPVLAEIRTVGQQIRRQLLSIFKSSIDDMTVEQKRAAIHTLVRKVVWDGVNAHVVLFGVSDEDIDYPEIPEVGEEDADDLE
jgi:hypothetical protein